MFFILNTTVETQIMKIAFIHNEKKIGTGSHYINDLMSMKLKEAGIDLKSFYPNTSLDTPIHLGGLKNILFFHSLLEKRKQILKFDLIQGTTYTPLTFLAYDIPVVSHFGSTTKGFLETTPRTITIDTEMKKIWHALRNNKVIKELNIKTRKPLRDIAEIEQYVASKAEGVIATSLKVKKELLNMGVKEENIYLVHNAIEDYWYENVEKINNKPLGNPSIVFLGRLGEDVFTLKLKGLDRLLNLYSYFPDIKKITICMTRKKELISWLIDEIPNHTVFANSKKDRIPEITKSLYGSILFIPSRYEGFSLSLVEGMSQGLIPIIYDVGVAPEIIQNGKNGFLVSSQKDAQEKINLLLNDENLRKKCAAQARITSLQFSSSLISKKLIDVYEKIIKQNPRTELKRN